MLQHRSYKIALGISLIVHIILLLLYKPISGISGWLELPKSSTIEDEPLMFELVDPAEPPQELVETPDAAQTETAPEDAQFLSDKNAQAQDMATENVPEGLSYSDGISDRRTFARGGDRGMAQMYQQQQPQQEQDGDSQNDDPEDQEGEEDPYTQGDAPIYNEAFSAMQKQKFSKELLQGAQRPTKQPPNNFSDDANWDNRDSSAEALGGVSLSTYNWDYAPYILYMKRRIRDHLYPPPAFMQMGAISGQVTVRFILRRDGTVRNLQMINNRGHKSFIDPSLNSVRASEPFKPLPESFPDPFLELTWTFVYSIYP